MESHVLGEANALRGQFPEPFLISDGAVASYLMSTDSTGLVLGSLRFMDQVEFWVLSELGVDEKSREEVKKRMDRLAEIISKYRNAIPSNSDALLSVLSWLNVSVTVYVTDYLSRHQSDFFMELVDYCRANESINVDAALMIKRIMALRRGDLVRRIFGPKNVEFVNRILFEMLEGVAE